MSRLWLIFFALVPWCHPSHGQTHTATSYSSLQSALESGKSVKIIIRFSSCTPVGSAKKVERAPDIISGFSPSSFQVFEKNAAKNNRAYIGLAHSILEESADGKGYVHQLTDVRVFEDGKVLIHYREISPLTFEPELSQQYETEMFDGVSETAGVFFYVN